jgi:ATP-dependent Clp protease ATP-binding subunit ClpC
MLGGPDEGPRAIQREDDNPLARLLLDGRLEQGLRITVGVRDGRLDLAVDQPATAGL